jgi:hypothetical protein
MRLPLVIALVSVGCGHLLPGGVRCSNSGGPEWHELTSRHFTLDTDLPAPEVAKWIEGLEQMEATVVAALVNTPRELPGRLRVVVAADERMWHRRARSRVANA